MATLRILIIGFLVSLLMALACSVDAQCAADTIPPGPPWPPFSDTTATGNDLLCYVPACGTCSTSSTCTIFPLDGCIVVGGDEGWVNAILRDSCSLVLLDTCFYLIPAAAIFGELCHNYTGFLLLTLCRDTAAALSVQWVPGFGSGWPTLTPIVSIDTLCSQLTAIAQPRPYTIPQSGYTDMLSRYSIEQPYGISFSWALHKKVLRIR